MRLSRKTNVVFPPLRSAIFVFLVWQFAVYELIYTIYTSEIAEHLIYSGWLYYINWFHP